MVGGILLAHFSRPSVFFALVPVPVLALTAAWLFVPESSNPDQAHIDIPGLVLSTAAIALLVCTIIEGPESGWGSPARVAGFLAAGRSASPPARSAEQPWRCASAHAPRS
ncbi:hypothetical protein [Streptomyces sp. NPDC093089]|uniref:hypothetical protein n=1 Tax=Streptomyces sp. NPDC093089 TaxID=3366024 RepID=UPI00382AE626